MDLNKIVRTKRAPVWLTRTESSCLIKQELSKK